MWRVEVPSLQGCWWGLYMDGKRIGYVHLFSPGRA